MTEKIYCDSWDHPRRTPALFRVTWPDSRYNPAVLCAGCTRRAFSDSVSARMPLLAAPISERYEVESRQLWGFRGREGVVPCHKDQALAAASDSGRTPVRQTVTTITGPWVETLRQLAEETPDE